MTDFGMSPTSVNPVHHAKTARASPHLQGNKLASNAAEVAVPSLTTTPNALTPLVCVSDVMLYLSASSKGTPQIWKKHIPTQDRGNDKIHPQLMFCHETTHSPQRRQPAPA